MVYSPVVFAPACCSSGRFQAGEWLYQNCQPPYFASRAPCRLLRARHGTPKYRADGDRASRSRLCSEPALCTIWWHELHSQVGSSALGSSRGKTGSEYDHGALPWQRWPGRCSTRMGQFPQTLLHRFARLVACKGPNRRRNRAEPVEPRPTGRCNSGGKYRTGCDPSLGLFSQESRETLSPKLSVTVWRCNRPGDLGRVAKPFSCPVHGRRRRSEMFGNLTELSRHTFRAPCF